MAATCAKRVMIGCEGDVQQGCSPRPTRCCAAAAGASQGGAGCPLSPDPARPINSRPTHLQGRSSGACPSSAGRAAETLAPAVLALPSLAGACTELVCAAGGAHEGLAGRQGPANPRSERPPTCSLHRPPPPQSHHLIRRTRCTPAVQVQPANRARRRRRRRPLAGMAPAPMRATPRTETLDGMRVQLHRMLCILVHALHDA